MIVNYFVTFFAEDRKTVTMIGEYPSLIMMMRAVDSEDNTTMHVYGDQASDGHEGTTFMRQHPKYKNFC